MRWELELRLYGCEWEHLRRMESGLCMVLVLLKSVACACW